MEEALKEAFFLCSYFIYFNFQMALRIQEKFLIEAAMD